MSGMTRANYPRYLSVLSSSTPKCIRFCQRVSFSAIFILNIMNNTLIKTSSPNSCFAASVSSPSRTFSPPSPYTPTTIHHRDMRRHCPTMTPNNHHSSPVRHDLINRNTITTPLQCTQCLTPYRLIATIASCSVAHFPFRPPFPSVSRSDAKH